MKRLDEEPTCELARESLEHDRLGRREVVAQFIQLLCNVNGPYSIFIDAPWGTGKTFFVKQIIETLRFGNPNIDANAPSDTSIFDSNLMAKLSEDPFLPIYFNAWENDHFNDPIAPLLATIATMADKTKVNQERSISDIAAGAIDCALSLTGLNTGKLLEAISGNDFLNAFRKRQELRAKTEELVSALLPEVANRAVLFIDELDRCRPEFAMQLLEQTKSLFLQDNIVVVYSTDRTQLAYSLHHSPTRQYHLCSNTEISYHHPNKPLPCSILLLYFKKPNTKELDNMALTHNQFKILNALSTASGATQRELSTMTDMGLATVNAALKECLDASLVDDGRLTAKGMAELKPYEVENAVILAAGLSSRFAPQIQIDPLVEGYGVAVATGLPVAGHARLHQQSLTLVVVVGCHLVRQRGARAHDAHVRTEHVDELRQLV